MVERTAHRQPHKVAVIHGETRTTYDDFIADRVGSFD
jgi:hypothetical protein